MDANNTSEKPLKQAQTLKLNQWHFVHVLGSVLTRAKVKIFVFRLRWIKKHLDSVFLISLISEALQVSHSNVSNGDGFQKLAKFVQDVNLKNFRLSDDEFREKPRTMKAVQLKDL